MTSLGDIEQPAGGLVAALARAQGNFGPIVKGHTNPHFRSKYADLSDVLAVVVPPLSAEGIFLSQPIQTDDDGRVRLYTVLEGHGEVRSSSLPLYLDNMNPQQMLSTVTYYRRGLLQSLLGVAAEDDDDGNAASTPVQKPVVATGDPNVLAAATPPEKPLRDMTAGEMARYGESIGVRVSGSKADILRTLEPYVQAATGEEPFDLPPPIKELPEDTRHATADVEGTLPPFEPVVADPMRRMPPDVRNSTRRGDR